MADADIKNGDIIRQFYIFCKHVMVQPQKLKLVISVSFVAYFIMLIVQTTTKIVISVSFIAFFNHVV